ncbi:MAG: pyridoxamine 5'-phosphate oxidase family protein [Ruminococcaceae bacterium]|nr:pyridoxamine 5'-phosphate oxidase family protein [Oscillospiraceae bacterium]
MFRDLARKKQRLSPEECVEILKTQTRGVLSVNGEDGYPYGMPMNHFYNEADGCVYFHTGRHGHRTDALKKDGRVSLCVYDQGYRKEGEWAYNVKSVIVFGKIEIIDDIDAVRAICEPLCRKFTDDEEYIKKELAESAKNTLLLKLTPEHICGKLVNEA